MWYNKEEFEKNQQSELDDGTYLDDGTVAVTCLHCGTKTEVLSAACCETRRKEDDKRTAEIMKSLSKHFGDY